MALGNTQVQIVMKVVPLPLQTIRARAAPLLHNLPMYITHEGPPARVGPIAQELEAQENIVRHDDPEERRTIGIDVAVVVILKVIIHEADDVIALFGFNGDLGLARTLAGRFESSTGALPEWD
ncbi:MAG: hypothetical protein ACYDHP_06145 [Ferrimicrobium sp.]